MIQKRFKPWYKRFGAFIIICICGIISTVINIFTGFINTKITAGGSVICIMGFIIAGNAMITLEEKKKIKK